MQTAIGQRARTSSEGQEVVQENKKSHLCGKCGKSQNSTSMFSIGVNHFIIVPKDANQHIGETTNLFVLQL